MPRLRPGIDVAMIGRDVADWSDAGAAAAAVDGDGASSKPDAAMNIVAGLDGAWPDDRAFVSSQRGPLRYSPGPGRR
jgi:hypothetical protein